MYRVLITGIHGSGKTTLAKKLSKKLNLPYIDNDLKQIENKDNLITLYPYITNESQIKLFLYLYNRELNTQIGIFDRGLLDNIAYTSILVKKKRFSQELFKCLQSLTLEMLQRFDLIIVKTRKQEGESESYSKEEKEVENFIFSFLDKYNFKYLINPNLEEIYENLNKDT